MNGAIGRAGDWCVVFFLLTLVGGGCHHAGGEGGGGGSAGASAKAQDADVFSSPQQAVQRIAELQAKQDWRGLARYYDLNGSDVRASALESGEYFGAPAGRAAPGGLGMAHREPFTPGFKFDHTEPTDRADVMRVVVAMEIDQGAGSPRQRGFDHFLLRKTPTGDYKLLPRPAAAVANPAAPPPSHPELQATSPEALVRLRPRLKEKLEKLPSATPESLPALLTELTNWQRRAQIAPLPPPLPSRVQTLGVEAFNPMDEQLMASETGQRIQSVVEKNPPADIDKVLDAAGNHPVSIKYTYFPIRTVNSAGEGPIEYFGKPEAREVTLPKKMTPH
jgi:hypothetical protein